MQQSSQEPQPEQQQMHDCQQQRQQQPVIINRCINTHFKNFLDCLSLTNSCNTTGILKYKYFKTYHR